MKFTLPFSVSILLSLLIGMLNPPEDTLSIAAQKKNAALHTSNHTPITEGVSTYSLGRGTQKPSNSQEFIPYIYPEVNSVSSLLAPAITATKSFVLLESEGGSAGPTPGDILKYTVVINNGATAGAENNATGVIFTDQIDANTTLVPGSLKSGPVAIDDSYSTVGNVSIAVPVGSGLMLNDVNLNGTPMTVTSIDDMGTMGDVTFNANGSFTFNPDPGFEGTTTFTYTVDNGYMTSTGTVTMTVTGMIWFINASAPAGGDGRINTPFNTMNAFNATSLDELGDNIFVYTGTYTNTSSTLLLEQQKLIGQGAVGASLAALAGVTFSTHPPISPATIPTVNGTNPVINQAANSINMQSRNEVRGVNINNTGGTSLLGSGFTSALVRQVSINNTGGTALNFNNGAMDAVFLSVSASNATNAISITNTTGSVQITGTGTTDASGGTLTNISGRGIDLRTATNITLKNMNLPSANATSDGGFDTQCDEDDVAACFAAIYMNGVSTVSLDNIDIGATEEHGIMGLSVSNLTINNCTATNNGNSNEENALKLRNLSGTCSITNSTFQLSAFRIAHIINTSGNLNLTVDNCTFNNTAASGVGADCFELRTQGSATGTVNLKNSNFTRARSKGIQVFAEGNSTLSLNITNCNVQRFGGLMAGIEVGSNGAAATLNYNLNNNPVIESSGEVAVLASTFNASDLNGRTNNNTSITNNNTTASIFANIRILHEGNGQAITEIKDNPSVVSSNIDIPVDMVTVNGSSAAARLDVILDNNNITNSTTTAAGVEGIVLRAGSNVMGTDINTLCGFVTRNDLTLPSGYPRAFRVRFLDPTSFMILQGPGPDVIANWTGNMNTNTNGLITSGPTTTITYGGTCLTPSHAAPASIMDEQIVVASVGNNDSLNNVAVAAIEPEKQESKAPKLQNVKPESDKSARLSAPEVSLSGETVTVGGMSGFALPAGKSITIEFKAVINSLLPLGTCAVSNQGTVTGANFTSVLTDDVTVTGSANPTVTNLSTHSLGNLVFKDNNKNGTFDGGDLGINGVTVNLYRDNGTIAGTLDVGDTFVATQTTAGGGLYSFANLCSGDYIVQIPAAEFGAGQELEGLLSSPQGAASDPDNNTDNDDNGQDALSGAIASQAIMLDFAGGLVENNTTLDFGFKTPINVTISDVTLAEGSGGGTTTFGFTVTRNDVTTAFDLTVNTSGGTAVSGTDFTAITNGTVSFAENGSATATVNVSVNADDIVELNEAFSVILSGAPAGVVLTDATGAGNITNDDQATFSVNSVTQNEGNAGTQNYSFTVSLDKAIDAAASVNIATSNGTATTADNDYVANSTTLNFTGTAGETKTFDVVVNGDLKVEPNETFSIALSSPSASSRNVVVSGMQNIGTGTITNDDAATISINDVTQAEGNAGTTTFTFNVTLSQVVSSAVTVDFATANGTATAGSDYTATSGTLTFPANGGGQTQTVSVTVAGDGTGEANETFFVNLTNIMGAAGVTFADNQGLGTIQDDDLSFSISDATIAEGNSGTTTLTFTVTRTSTSTTETINYQTADNTATTADNDYVAKNGTLTFAVGDASEDIVITLNGDLKVEPNETFFVNLSNLSNGSISDGQGQGTLTNDDAAVVTLSGGTAKNEGAAGTTSYTFTATLNNPVQGGFSVAYTTTNGTATVIDNDYVYNDGNLSFAGTSGEQKTITVLVNGDNKVELDEVFTVALGAITLAPAGVTTAGSPQTGTITNDDAATVALVGNVSQSEALTPQAFSVTLSNPVDVVVTVNFSTTDGTATTADNDYTGITNQVVTFAVGTTTAQTVNVTVANDAKVEANEGFNVGLSTLGASGRNVSLGTSSGTGTIQNDDAATVTLTIPSTPYLQSEGNSGTTSYVFTATLNNPVQGGFQVAYTTNDGLAIAPEDYTDNDGSLTFAGTAGETKTITVLANGDLKVEANEDFTVALGAITSAPEGVTVVGSPKQAVITNDELDFGDAPDTYNTLLGSNGARHNTSVAFHLGATVDGDVDGQPTPTGNGDDIDAEGDDDDGVTLPSAFITGTTANITVNASGAGFLNAWVDFNNDGDFGDMGEQVFTNQALATDDNNLTIAVPAGAVPALTFARFRYTTATVMTPSFVGLQTTGEVEDYQVNILNTQFSVSSPTVAEGNASTTSLTFVITRTNNANAASVDYAITGGTATSGTDYVALASGTANFTAGGALTQNVTVTVNGDLVVEDNETVILTLSNPVGGGISTATGTGSITNDDLATLTLSGGTAKNEGFSGTVSYTFTATLNAAVQGGFGAPYTTNNGTATVADNDYVDNDGNLSFVGTSGEQKTITVLVNGDNKVELNETFTTALGALTGLTPVQLAAITITDSPQTGTITNDDVATVAFVGNISELESTTPQTFSVSLSNPVDVNITVNFSTADSTATTADNDYTGITNQTVTFTAGSTTAQTVNVGITNDSKVEINEIYKVALTNLASSGRNVILGTSTGRGNIQNDDGATLTLSGGTSKAEGNSGTIGYTFTATLNNAVQGGFSVAYTTNDSTATVADNDYTDNDGTLTFTGTAGEAKDITVLVKGDSKVEADEAFNVILGAISGTVLNASIARKDTTQIGNIINDEIDFGDAPASYGTLTANNGARHATVLGMYLGNAIDGDEDGQPTATANGDDTDTDGDDEDGVTFPNFLLTGTSTSVSVTASVAGKLDAWIDFNQDGDFDDMGERIANALSLTAGSNQVTFSVPVGSPDGNAPARFRLSSAGGLNATGLAPDGEVEDYVAAIINTLRIYVNFANANPSQDGSTWAKAFSDLQAGLNAAATSMFPDIEIWVAQGTYKPGTLRSDVFKIPSKVRLYGGFVGTEINLSERDWVTHPVILSGEIGTTQRNDNSYHVVLFKSTDSLTRLDGFRIERGFAEFVAGTQNINVPDLLASGGGILAIEKSKGLITNCVITDNRAIGGGGMLLRDSSQLAITKTIIYGNEATFGGGVYVLGGSKPYFENVLMVINKGLGGGMYVNGSQPNLMNCTIASNKDDGSNAGGIFNANSLTTVKNSILWGNTSPQSTTGSVITYSTIEGGFVGLGNSNQNPLFVNPNPNGLAPLGTLGDYHLQICSPAINGGDNAGAPNEDLEGNVRPFPVGLGIVDRGVFESQSSGSSGPANLTVTEPITSGTVLKVADKIVATNQVSGATVVYQAGKSVTLLPGFTATVGNGNSFQALIGGCDK